MWGNFNELSVFTSEEIGLRVANECELSTRFTSPTHPWSRMVRHFMHRLLMRRVYRGLGKGCEMKWTARLGIEVPCSDKRL